MKKVIRKDGSIRKTRLISKSMMSQPDLEKTCNTHIAQYLKRYRQPGNGIWSVNRI